MIGIPVTNIEQLKKDANKDGGQGFYIALKGGIRSSKHISWDEYEKTFWVLNEVDDSEQELAETELMDESITNIGKAIKQSAFFRYEY